MERIIIKELDLKPSGMLVVKYVVKGIAAMPISDATMNTKWQSQEVDYIMKDVGVGGSVEVELVQKPNAQNPAKPWNNITNVNLESAEKGVSVSDTEKPTEPKPVNLKDEKIYAAVLLKGAIEMSKGHAFANVQDEENFLCEKVQMLHTVYKVALSVQNGN